MAGICIRLMLVVLCFSTLVCNNGAIPFTRSRNLMQKSPGHEIAVRGKNWGKGLGTKFSARRMEIQLNDYPGSGANNRHTPRPQPGRGCIDC